LSHETFRLTKQAINDELSIHSHPSSRINDGKGRTVQQALLELKNHYMYSHHKT